MEWQRHFERHATPQMGRNCGFWVYRTQRSSAQLLPRRQGVRSATVGGLSTALRWNVR
jgi:hypothetical protein